jgi:hypothetical protein
MYEPYVERRKTHVMVTVARLKGYSDREWSYKRFVYLQRGGEA